MLSKLNSLLSEFFLLLSLDPISGYTMLSLFFGVFIVTLLYFFLRGNDVNRLPAGIASLLALYIANGATIPGLWVLFPLTLGIVSLLIGLQPPEQSH